MKYIVWFFLYFVIILSACYQSNQQQEVSKEMNNKNSHYVIQNLKQLEKYAGKEVLIEGKYQELNVNQKLNKPPLYIGRVIIILKDGNYVLLETHNEGIRSEEEIKNQIKGHLILKRKS